MEAKLISFTPNPLALIWYTYHHEKHGVPYPEYPQNLWPSTPVIVQEAMDLLLEGWGPFLELPTTVWALRLPRSLHAQFRVHRHISPWSQSHQLYKPTNFADNEDYWIPADMAALEKQVYQAAMQESQSGYQRMLRCGMLPSIARQVLPQAINLGLTAGINLRALVQLAINRRCHIFQGTMWNPLLDMMRDEIILKVHPALGVIFNLQPCDINWRCLSNIEQLQRHRGEDPHAVCPRWKAMMNTDGQSNCCASGCEGCLKHAVRAHIPVKRSTKE